MKNQEVCFGQMNQNVKLLGVIIDSRIKICIKYVQVLVNRHPVNRILDMLIVSSAER